MLPNKTNALLVASAERQELKEALTKGEERVASAVQKAVKEALNPKALLKFMGEIGVVCP